MGSGQALSTAQDRGPSGPTILAELKHKLLEGDREQNANRFVVEEGGVGAHLLRCALGCFCLLVVAAAVIILSADGKQSVTTAKTRLIPEHSTHGGL